VAAPVGLTSRAKDPGDASELHGACGPNPAAPWGFACKCAFLKGRSRGPSGSGCNPDLVAANPERPCRAPAGPLSTLSSERQEQPACSDQDTAGAYPVARLQISGVTPDERDSDEAEAK